MSEVGRFERLRHMRNATLAQFGSVAVGIAGTALTGNPNYAVEIIHSSADGLVHGSRYGAELSGVNQDSKKFLWFLRGGLLFSAGVAAYVGARVGLDIAHGVQLESTPKDDVVNVIGAAAIAGSNTFASRQMNDIEEHSPASRVGRFHASVDKFVSWGAAAFLTANAAGFDRLSQYGAVGCAAVTAGALTYEAVTLGHAGHHH